jgi:hypothetical protein
MTITRVSWRESSSPDQHTDHDTEAGAERQRELLRLRGIESGLPHRDRGGLMTLRLTFCPACDVWSVDAACWYCGQPASSDPRTYPQRSWRDPATWVPGRDWEGGD